MTEGWGTGSSASKPGMATGKLQSSTPSCTDVDRAFGKLIATFSSGNMYATI